MNAQEMMISNSITTRRDVDPILSVSIILVLQFFQCCDPNSDCDVIV